MSLNSLMPDMEEAMARPRSEDKQIAIIEAAIGTIASHGLVAPTTLIARQAGVAEGTIFRYFPTKDDLLNAVFLHLKQSLRDAAESVLAGVTIEERARSSWNGYVDWGIAHPQASKTLNQLSVSDRITSDSRARADALFPELRELSEVATESALDGCGDGFVDVVFSALADAVMSFVSRHPDRAEACKAAGFFMLWKGMSEPTDG